MPGRLLGPRSLCAPSSSPAWLRTATHGQRLRPLQAAVHEIPALRATKFLCHRLLEAGKARLADANRDVVRRLGSLHAPGRSILTAGGALLLDGLRRRGGFA